MATASAPGGGSFLGITHAAPVRCMEGVVVMLWMMWGTTRFLLRLRSRRLASTPAEKIELISSASSFVVHSFFRTRTRRPVAVARRAMIRAIIVGAVVLVVVAALIPQVCPPAVQRAVVGTLAGR